MSFKMSFEMSLSRCCSSAFRVSFLAEHGGASEHGGLIIIIIVTFFAASDDDDDDDFDNDGR